VIEAHQIEFAGFAAQVARKHHETAGFKICRGDVLGRGAALQPGLGLIRLRLIRHARELAFAGLARRHEKSTCSR
jgi:hypothetical protein